MRVEIPRGLRYRTVNLLESTTSPFLSWPLRGLIFLSLLTMATPWSVAREIAFGAAGHHQRLKTATRSMLWVWNRSWIPFRFQIGTYFDIGWHISADSCSALVRRGFLSRPPLKRQCDLAQMQLAIIRQAIEAADEAGLQQADRKLCTLVSSTLNEAAQWAAALPPVPMQPVNSKIPSITPDKTFDHQFNNERTRAALLAFDDLAQKLELRYFLVSGTFLGVVRDGTFIGHDHDIDLGVFEADLPQDVLSALAETDEFRVTEVDRIYLRHPGKAVATYSPMKSPAIIRLAHRNGISIDLFIHFRDGSLEWHGSSVHRWNNVVFELCDYPFLGRHFKGAVDFDRYLSENYGEDWRVPKKEFNVNLDTPNLDFVGTSNALVFYTWMIINAVHANDARSVRNYIEMLVAHGAVEHRDGLLSIK